MNLPKLNINECIAEAFNKQGYNSVEVNENYCKFEPLDLEIRGEIENINEEQSVKSIRIKIELFSKKFKSGSINEFVYGMGKDSKAAAINSFERWIDSDFSVIHDYIADHKIGEEINEELDMASSSTTGEQIPWKIILGPLQNFDGQKLRDSG